MNIPWITTHQPYLDAIAEEINNLPRATLNWRTSLEAYQQLLADTAVASTN